jgi:hypothetical protein
MAFTIIIKQRVKNLSRRLLKNCGADSKTMDFRLKRTGFKGPRGQVDTKKSNASIAFGKYLTQ